jgi:excisionase family DNA binding protein
MSTTTRPAPCPALLTIALVADRLAVSPRHVRRLIERAELPAHRIGSAVRISEDDLARYLASTRHT